MCDVEVKSVRHKSRDGTLEVQQLCSGIWLMQLERTMFLKNTAIGRRRVLTRGRVLSAGQPPAGWIAATLGSPKPQWTSP